MVAVDSVRQRKVNRLGVELHIVWYAEETGRKTDRTSNMDFVLRKLDDYSDEAILQEMQRVAVILGETNFTKEAFSKESMVSVTTIQRRFGSWKKALSRAGLESWYKWKGTVTEKMFKQDAKNWSDKQLIDEIKRVANSSGEITVDKFNRNS